MSGKLSAFLKPKDIKRPAYTTFRISDIIAQKETPASAKFVANRLKNSKSLILWRKK